MTKPRTRELCDLVDFYSGGTPARSNEKFWGGDVPWVSGKDMKQFRLDGSQEHITNHAVEKGARCLDPGAILVLVRGMALFKGVPTGILTCRAAFNQDIKALVARNGVNPIFLAYAVAARQNILQSFVTAAGHGTGRLITEALETLRFGSRKRICRPKLWRRCALGTMQSSSPRSSREKKGLD